MNNIPQLLPIEFNNDKIKNTLLTNVTKMLTNRKLLKQEDLDDNIKKVTSADPDDNVYKFSLVNKIKNNDGKVANDMYVKIINQKISALNKASGGNIIHFLTKYKDFPKILIIKDITDKIIKIIDEQYFNTEIFLEHELMINIVDHVIVPEHQILTPDEVKDVIRDYNTAITLLPKILTTDPVARYYNMKHGQVCKIIRPSETSILVPFYRLVVKK